MAVFDVFATNDACIKFLNSNRYDIVFIHQLLLWACFSCLYNLIDRSCNYGAIMSLCDFTAFLRIPFSESDFLHYVLKYVFEPYESHFMKAPLQRIPKKNRLRYQGIFVSFY